MAVERQVRSGDGSQLQHTHERPTSSEAMVESSLAFADLGFTHKARTSQKSNLGKEIAKTNERIENVIIFDPNRPVEFVPIQAAARMTVSAGVISSQPNPLSAEPQVGVLDPKEKKRREREALLTALTLLRGSIPARIIDETAETLQRELDNAGGGLTVNPALLQSAAAELVRELQGDQIAELRIGDLSEEAQLKAVLTAKMKKGLVPAESISKPEALEIKDPERLAASNSAALERSWTILEKKAVLYAQKRGELLAVPSSDKGALQALDEEFAKSCAVHADLLERPGFREHLKKLVQLHEDEARLTVVAERVREMGENIVRARGVSGSGSDVAIEGEYERFMASQQDLLARYPELANKLGEYRHAAEKRLESLFERMREKAAVVLWTMKGIGTYEKEFFAEFEGITSEELHYLKKAFDDLGQGDLETWVRGDFGGKDLQKALACIHGESAVPSPKPAKFSFGDVFARSKTELAKGMQVLLSADRAQAQAVELYAAAKSDNPVLAVAQIMRDKTEAERGALRAAFERVYSVDFDAFCARELSDRRMEIPTLTGVIQAASDRELTLKVVRGQLLTNEESRALIIRSTIEYAQKRGSLLGAGVAEESEAIRRLDEGRVHFDRILMPLFREHPELGTQLRQLSREVEAQARMIKVQQRLGELSVKIGELSAVGGGRYSKSAQQEAQTALAEYLVGQQKFLAQYPQVAAELERVQSVAKEQGRQHRIKAEKAVEDLYYAMHGGTGLGTDEAKIFRTLGGMTSEQLQLMRRLYQEKYGNLEYQLRDELSSHDYDKALGLLHQDIARESAADFHAAMRGFWGPDRKKAMAAVERLHEGLKAKSLEEQKEARERFGAEVLRQCEGRILGRNVANLDQALDAYHFKETEQRVVQACLEGDDGKIASAKMVEKLARTSVSAEEIALELEKRLIDPMTSKVDLSRATQLLEAYRNSSGGADLREVITHKVGAEHPAAKWALALLEGDDQARVRAAAYRLRYSMKGLVTYEELARETFQLPPEVEALPPGSDARVQAERAHAAFRQEVAVVYKQELGRDLEEDFRSELRGYDLTCQVSMMKHGRLSAAERLALAAGGDWDGTLEDEIKVVLSGRSESEMAEIREEFKKITGRSLESMLTYELSGDDYFDCKQMAEGLPLEFSADPAKNLEAASKIMRLIEERHNYARSGLLSGLASRQAAQDEEAEYQTARRFYEEAMADGVIDCTEHTRLISLIGRHQVYADNFRDAKNALADTAANTVVVVGMVGVTIATVGTTAPLWAIMLGGAAASAAARSTVKVLVKGRGTTGDVGVLAAESTIDGATLGIGMGIGGKVSSTIAAKVGEAAAARGVVMASEQGTKLVGAELGQAVMAKSLIGRLGSNMAVGVADGTVSGSIQASSLAAIDEHTWRDGFKQGLINIGYAGLEGGAMGATTGTALGGVFSLRAPRHVKMGAELSPGARMQAMKDGVKPSWWSRRVQLNKAGLQLLEERFKLTGCNTRGDLLDAALASRELTARQTRKILARAAREGKTQWLDIAKRRPLTQRDWNLISGKFPHAYQIDVDPGRILDRQIKLAKWERAQLMNGKNPLTGEPLSAAEAKVGQMRITAALDQLEAARRDAAKGVLKSQVRVQRSFFKGDAPPASGKRHTLPAETDLMPDKQVRQLLSDQNFRGYDTKAHDDLIGLYVNNGKKLTYQEVGEFCRQRNIPKEFWEEYMPRRRVASSGPEGPMRAGSDKAAAEAGLEPSVGGSSRTDHAVQGSESSRIRELEEKIAELEDVREVPEYGERTPYDQARYEELQRAERELEKLRARHVLQKQEETSLLGQSTPPEPQVHAEIEPQRLERAHRRLQEVMERLKERGETQAHPWEHIHDQISSGDRHLLGKIEKSARDWELYLKQRNLGDKPNTFDGDRSGLSLVSAEEGRLARLESWLDRMEEFLNDNGYGYGRLGEGARRGLPRGGGKSEQGVALMEARQRSRTLKDVGECPAAPRPEAYRPHLTSAGEVQPRRAPHPAASSSASQEAQTALQRAPARAAQRTPHFAPAANYQAHGQAQWQMQRHGLSQKTSLDEPEAHGRSTHVRRWMGGFPEETWNDYEEGMKKRRLEEITDENALQHEDGDLSRRRGGRRRRINVLASMGTVDEKGEWGLEERFYYKDDEV